MRLRIGMLLCLAVLAGCQKAVSTVATWGTATTVSPTVPTVSSPPRAVLPAGLAVEPAVGQLGTADFGDTRECTFTLRNTRPQQLRVSVVRKSCACAGIHVEKSEIPSGGQTTARLTWIPKLESTEEARDLDFIVWADLQIEGADETFRLEAKGQLKPRLRLNFPGGRPDLGRINLADLKAGSKELAVEICTGAAAELKLTATLSHPGLQLSPPEALSAERLKELEASAGYRLRLKPLPTLPTGAFQESLMLATNLYPEPLTLRVTGRVENGAVSVVPEQLDLATARLSLREGYRCPPLRLRLRGTKPPTLKIESIDPPVFEARLEKAKEGEWVLETSLLPAETVRQVLGPEKLEELTTFGFDKGFIRVSTGLADVPEISIPISSGRLRL